MENSFEEALHWIEDCKTYASETTNLILAGTYEDLPLANGMTSKIQSLYDEGFDYPIVPVSAKTGNQVTSLFNLLISDILLRVVNERQFPFNEAFEDGKTTPRTNTPRISLIKSLFTRKSKTPVKAKPRILKLDVAECKKIKEKFSSRVRFFGTNERLRNNTSAVSFHTLNNYESKIVASAASCGEYISFVREFSSNTELENLRKIDEILDNNDLLVPNIHHSGTRDTLLHFIIRYGSAEFITQAVARFSQHQSYVQIFNAKNKCGEWKFQCLGRDID